MRWEKRKKKRVQNHKISLAIRHDVYNFLPPSLLIVLGDRKDIMNVIEEIAICHDGRNLSFLGSNPQYTLVWLFLCFLD